MQRPKPKRETGNTKRKRALSEQQARYKMGKSIEELSGLELSGLDNTKDKEPLSLPVPGTSFNQDVQDAFNQPPAVEASQMGRQSCPQSSINQPPIPPTLSTPGFLQARADWISYRGEHGSTVGPMQMRKLYEMFAPRGPEVAIASISECIAGGAATLTIRTPRPANGKVVPVSPPRFFREEK